MPTTPHILIAEDDDLFRELLVIFLQRGRPHWHLRITANGREAYQAYQQYGADLILANDVMPEMDGIDLVTAVRALGAQTPIILITSRATTRHIVAHDAATVIAAKPIGEIRLMQIMDQVLEHWRA